MTIRQEYALGDAYHEVATVPATQPQERLTRAISAQLAALGELCTGVAPASIVALAFGVSRVGAADLDEAAETCDVQALCDARRRETNLWRVSQLLLSFVDTDGVRIPDKALAAGVVQLAHAAVGLGMIRDDAWGRRRRLRDVDVRVQGRKLVVTFAESDTFDAGEYEQTLVSGWLDPEATGDKEVIRGTFAAIQGDGPLPTELRQADRLMTTEHGTSLLHLLRTAHALSTHPRDVTTVIRHSLDALVDEVTDRVGDRVATAAALRLFTTDLAELRRHVRDALPPMPRTGPVRWRPLLRAPDGRQLYAPIAFSTRFQSSYIKGALNGAWPTALPAGPFASYLSTRRQTIRPRKDFEPRVRRAAQATVFGAHVAANVEPRAAAARIGVAISREIDVLAADPDRHLLWVISAKDAEQVLEDAQLKNQLGHFYGGNRDTIGGTGHVAVLHRMVRSLAPHAATVAEHLGVPDPADRPWSVRGLFVTRVPSPAAADRRRTYPVVLLDALRDYLDNPPAIAPESTPEAAALLQRLNAP